jgi:Domain of unknown function (DUF397)
MIERNAVWRTSSHSGEQGGECVQVAIVEDEQTTVV